MVKYTPLTDEFNAESAAVKVSDIIDIAVQLAIETRDIDKLLECANAYAQMVQILAPEEEEIVIEEDEESNGFGFGINGSQCE